MREKKEDLKFKFSPLSFSFGSYNKYPNQILLSNFSRPGKMYLFLARWDHRGGVELWVGGREGNKTILEFV